VMMVSKTNSGCNDRGTVHASGTDWPCSDGCNTCSCNGGEITETALVCPLDGSEGREASVPEASNEDEAEAESGLYAPPRSCQPGGPGMTNCGTNGESCCTSLEVPGGAFYRIYDVDPTGLTALALAADGGPAGEAAPATVSSLNLDKYDVTVGRFRQFVSAWNGGWLPTAASGKHTHLNGGQGLMNVAGDAGVVYEAGWVTTDDASIAPTNANLACSPTYSTWTVSAGRNENLPINCVNWYEAYAFCISDGGFLPSENEWQYAAVGGSQQRAYPWGSANPGTTNQYAIYNCDYPNGPADAGSVAVNLFGTGVCTGVASIAPVGTPTLGAGLWGQRDLAGNVFALVLDSYSNGYSEPCTDCAYLTAASSRVFRGGSFSDSSNNLPPHRSALLDYDPASPPLNRDYHTGFRCARAP
jgi:formylglycine-generating enzyme